MTIEQWILIGCVLILLAVLVLARAIRISLKVIDGNVLFLSHEQLQSIFIKMVHYQGWCAFTICTCGNNGKRDPSSHDSECNYVKFCRMISVQALRVIQGTEEDKKDFNKKLFMVAAGRRGKG